MRAGLGFVGAGKRLVSIDFITSNSSTTNGTSRNYSLTIPSYGKTVLMVVGMASRSVSTAHAFSSATWNGVSGTSIAATGTGITNNYIIAGMFSFLLPVASQGATANLTVVTNNTSADQSIGVWIVKDYTSTTPLIAPTDTNTSANTLVLPYGTRASGDATIAFVSSYNTSNIDWSSSGTEDFDDDTAANGEHFAGYRETIVSAGAFNKTLTSSSNFLYGVAVGAAFR